MNIVAVVPSNNAQEQYPTDFSALMAETELKLEEKTVTAAGKKVTGKSEAKTKSTVEVKSENVDDGVKSEVEKKMK